jgi:hypothetical protein
MVENFYTGHKYIDVLLKYREQRVARREKEP